MGDTSLTVSGYTFVFDTDSIEKVECTIESNVENNEITATGPMGSRNYDFNGCKKTIVITGHLSESSSTRVAGYSVTTKISQKQWLESMINGNQAQIELTDDIESQTIVDSTGTAPNLGGFTSTLCMTGTMKFWRMRGNPNQLFFNITLLVGN